jgi:DNA topoisomerase-2
LPRDPKLGKQCLEKLLSDSTPRADTIQKLLKPTFVGWSGSVVEGDGPNKFELHGILEVVNTTTIKVKELPVGYGVDKFKAILVDLMDKGKVKDYDNNSSEKGFDFEIKVPREVTKLSNDELMKLFKLVSRQSENVTLWDKDGKIKAYENVYEALKDFLEYRLDRYEVRRVTQIKLLKEEIDFLKAKQIFIEEWNRLADPAKTKTSDIEKVMIKAGVKEEYLPRLMAMRISSLTLEQVNELEMTIKDKQSNVSELSKLTAKDIYLKELKAL